MEDKELSAEGQAQAPEAEKAPEVATDIESPAVEVDKDLSEWATNKGYSEDDLKDDKVQKAIKMAYNAEKMIGKSNPTQAEEASDGDLDKLLEEILGESATPETRQEAVKTIEGLDESKLSDADRATLELLKAEARTEARKVIAPYESELRKKQMRTELEGLHKEFGDDVIKNAPAILAKTKTGTSLRDATISVLNETILKQALSKGVEQGKEIKAKEISQQVEQSKKADSGVLPDYDKLSLDEQRKVLEALSKK